VLHLKKGKMTVMLCPDRQRGTIFGLAVGDAFGAAVEFQMPGSDARITEEGSSVSATRLGARPSLPA
jgi:hypothetical protein